MAGEVPGWMNVINALQSVLVGTGIYVLPILTYVFLFKKTNILCEIIMGTFSFIFYGPTYLNILNIYSLCRIDDISWGTKGTRIWFWG
jgi:chitin synthase